MEHIFNELNKIIEKYDNFIIMGHKNPDLDSLGSSLGLYNVIKHFNKNPYVYINESEYENYNENFNVALSKLKESVNFISEDINKDNTLVVVTDVHTKNRVDFEDVIGKYDVIVLDHHIRNNDYIKENKLMYIDTNLSSMCELLAFYLNYLKISIDTITATIMLAGIEIDTNSFNLKTTSNTYIAAAILTDMGADTILKQVLLKETKEEYIKRVSYIKASFMVDENTAMCIINKQVTNVNLAEIAEELLTFHDVKASYVIGKLSSDIVGISARSLGDIDVSKVMKQLGGGGHMSNAATQIKGKTIKEVKQMVIDLIKEK